jgi:hypothetical protein
MEESVNSEQNVTPRKPASILVFGILNIVFASCGLISLPFSIIICLTQSNPLFDFAGPLYKGWTMFSSVIGILATIILLVSGIGLCLTREWARKLAVGYGWFGIVFGSIGVIINIIIFLPRFSEIDPAMFGGAIGGTCGGIIGLVYPVLLIIFLSKEKVRQAMR